MSAAWVSETQTPPLSGYCHSPESRSGARSESVSVSVDSAIDRAAVEADAEAVMRLERCWSALRAVVGSVDPIGNAHALLPFCAALHVAECTRGAGTTRNTMASRVKSI